MKGVNFFGLKSEYVVSGSDCGHIFLWDKTSQEVVQMLEGDHEGVVGHITVKYFLYIPTGLVHCIYVCSLSTKLGQLIVYVRL